MPLRLLESFKKKALPLLQVKEDPKPPIISPQDKFEPIFQRTLGLEGGKTVDEGGKTNLGVTQTLLDNYNKQQNLPPEDVNIITPGKARTVYEEEFWKRPKLDLLPDKPGSMQFDYGVQSSPNRAVKSLQKTIGTIADGVIGPKTIKATEDYIKKHGEKDLLQKLIDDRVKFLETTPAFKTKSKGLMNRIQKIKDEFDLSQINPFHVGEAEAGTVGQAPERLPLLQRALSSEPANKIIDFLSGGASLKEAEQYSQQQIENIKNLPKVIPALNPFTPVEKQEEALRAFSTPLETISRVPTALQKLAFPTEGQGRAESAIKGLMRPDLVPPGYLGGEISKRFPEPEPGTEISMLSPRVLTPGILGALGEILSYELGLGALPSRLARGYKATKFKSAAKEMDSILDKATPKAVALMDKKGAFPKGWNKADKVGRTRSFLKQQLSESPEVGDILMARQTPSKVLFGGLKGKAGEAKPLPEPIKPKLTDIKSLAGPTVKKGVITPGKDVADQVVGLTEEKDSFALDNIKKEDYVKKTLKIEDVIASDKDLAESLKGELEAPADEGDIDSPIIIDSKGAVLDGYHRVKAKQEAGVEDIDAYVGVKVDDKAEIPDFKNTEEALAFGEQATPEQIEMLKVKREEVLKKNKELLAKESPTKEELQEGMDVSVKGQFYREALETSKEKVKKYTPEEQDILEEIESFSEINPDKTVTLYHRTSKENAEKILNTGEMTAKENAIFFSTKEAGQIKGYGDTTIKMKVPLSKLEIDDIFADEAHLAIPLKKAGEIKNVKKYLVEPVKAEPEIITPPKEPPKKPPIAGGFEGEGWEDLPPEKKESFKSEFEGLTDKQLVKELSDLVSFFEPGQLTLDLEDNYSRLSSGFLPEFSNKGYTQKYLQGIYKKYTEGTKLTDKEADVLVDTLNSFKEMFGIEPSKNIPDIITTKDIRKSKANLKIIQKLAKSLSRGLPVGKVKKTIREKTGVTKLDKLVISERQAFKEKFKQQAREAKLGKREGKAEGVEETKARVKEVLVSKKARKELSDEIKKNIKDIKAMPTGELPIDIKDMIEDIKMSVDFETVGLKKILQKEKIRKNLELEGLDQQVHDLSNITARDMNVEELRLVHETIQRLYHEGLHANKLYTMKGEHEFSALVREGSEMIEKAGGVKDLPNIEKMPKNWVEKTLEWKSNYVAEHLPPETIIQSLDNYVDNEINQKIIFNPLNDAANKEASGLEAGYKNMSGMFEGVDIGEILGKKVKIKGLKRPLTRNEMLDIYAMSFDDYQIGHMVETGITDQMIFDIERKLTDGEKSLVKKLFKYYDTVQYERIDKVYSKLNGIHMSKRENYFPTQQLEDVSDMEAIEMDVKGRADFLRAGVSKGFTIERTGGKQAFKNLDFIGKIVKNLIQAEHYISHAEAVRDASKYLRNPTIRKSIKNNFGDHVYSLLDKWIQDVARGREEGSFSAADKFAKMLRGNFVIYALWLNASSVSKAPASFLQGSEYIGKVNALRSLMKFFTNPFGEIELVKKKSVQMKHRSYSQQKELVEMMSERGIIRHFGKIKPALTTNQIKEIKQMIREWGMVPWQIADRVTTTIIWRGAYDSKIRELGPEAEQEAIRWADKAVRRTQPQSRLVDQADILRSNIWKKMMMVFKSQPIQNFSLIHDTYIQMKKSGKAEGWSGKHTRQKAMNLFYYTVICGLLFDTLRRKRLPKNWEEVGFALLNNAFGGLWGISDIISKVEYPWGSANMVDNLIKDIAGIKKSKKAKTKAKHAISAASQLRGYPYVTTHRALTRENLKTKILGGEKEKKVSTNRL